jgi:hypothetical protein
MLGNFFRVDGKKTSCANGKGGLMLIIYKKKKKTTYKDDRV